MSSNELRNKTEITEITGEEWLYSQDVSSPYTVKKLKSQTLIDYINSLISLTVGSSVKYEETFIDISESHPWFCLSKPSEVLTTTNYSQSFIDARRARKWTYDEAGASPVSSFSGAWASNVFTLDNNATNIAFLTELLEDWVFHGSPATGWRILHDGTEEFNITNIVLSTRQITVNLDSKTATGTSIEVYLNRVYGSTTSCKHFSEAGLADYQAGGDKFAGALRRDQMQRITGEVTWQNFGRGDISITKDGAFSSSSATGGPGGNSGTSSSSPVLRFDSYFSPNARTSATTAGRTKVHHRRIKAFMKIKIFEEIS